MEKLITRNLSKNLTSRDLLKSLALILMVVDHIGFFFFPDDMWWRLWGRLCVPMWFFLIGYADSRIVPISWYIGAGLLVISNIVFGEAIFALPILLNFALCRLIIDRTAKAATDKTESMLGVYFMCILFALHSSVFLEYGTLGILLALVGYFNRHFEHIPMQGSIKALFMVMAVLGFGVIQQIYLPNVTYVQAAFLYSGLLGVAALLFFFKSRELPPLPKYIQPIKYPFQLLGRWTLEFYVLHIIVLSALRYALLPAENPLLTFKLMPQAFEVLFG